MIRQEKRGKSSKNSSNNSELEDLEENLKIDIKLIKREEEKTPKKSSRRLQKTPRKSSSRRRLEKTPKNSSSRRLEKTPKNSSQRDKEIELPLIAKKKPKRNLTRNDIMMLQGRRGMINLEDIKKIMPKRGKDSDRSDIENDKDSFSGEGEDDENARYNEDNIVQVVKAKTLAYNKKHDLRKTSKKSLESLEFLKKKWLIDLEGKFKILWDLFMSVLIVKKKFKIFFRFT